MPEGRGPTAGDSRDSPVRASVLVHRASTPDGGATAGLGILRPPPALCPTASPAVLIHEPAGAVRYRADGRCPRTEGRPECSWLTRSSVIRHRSSVPDNVRGLGDQAAWPGASALTSPCAS